MTSHALLVPSLTPSGENPQSTIVNRKSSIYNPVWGAAALAAIAGAAAYALERQRRRREEEAQSARQAAMDNARAEALEAIRQTKNAPPPPERDPIDSRLDVAEARLEERLRVEPKKPAVSWADWKRSEPSAPVVKVCIAAERSKPWWQRAGEWISSPSTWWGLSTEDEAVKLMQKTRGFPDIPIILPVLKGFGMDDVAGPLKYTLKTDTTIRLIGRILDDFSPGVLTGIGWGLTVTPNLVKNIRNKNPWHQTTADLIVDTGGFWVSEAAGWVVGGGVGVALAFTPLAPVAPYVTLGIKVFVDGAVSMIWDYLAERYRWSDWLSQHLEKGARSLGESMINSMQQAFDTEKYPRLPTPPTPQVTETPTPLGQNPDVQPSGTPVPGHTSTSTAPSPTRPPIP